MGWDMLRLLGQNECRMLFRGQHPGEGVPLLCIRCRQYGPSAQGVCCSAGIAGHPGVLLKLPCSCRCAAVLCAVQKFAQSLLEVADNLESAAKAVPSNIVQQGADVPAETALKYLRSLLEGVQATERVLLKVRHCSSTGHACGCGMHGAAAWLASSVSCG